MPVNTSKYRIFIVSDKPDELGQIVQILKEDHEVLTATNGLEALDHVDRYEPDLIIVSASMASLDGFDTVRAIRKDARFRVLPAVLLVEPQRPAPPAEIDDLYVELPFGTAQLRARITGFLADRGADPSPKRFSITELATLEAAGATAASISPPPISAIAGPARTSSLTEQLAQALVEPRIRLMVVDDEPDTVKFVRAVLAKDYETFGVSDPDLAPDKILAYQPDVILVDSSMPQLSGIHLAQIIRLNKRMRASQLIFLAARSDKAAVEKACASGAADQIEKPFTAEQLRRKVRDAIKRPGFVRQKKRVEFEEILRREGEIAG
ncbi:MAG: response regulator [Candidatus Sumerlaeaceae bacterium]|nr:response regulator [Candidatus Sumerlaeaceae bacterium]